MSLRLLFGMLASALPEQKNYSETMEVPEKVLPSSSEESWIKKFHIAGAKLHIGMLTISLIVGLAYGGFVSYTYWREKDVFLGYIRNLVIALVCRTFFTIIFDGVVLLGSPSNIGGGNTLSALEQICINLVLGLWLSLTVYAHARVQRNFKSEPTLRLYQFGIPAVAAFFAFVWIFKMQAAFPNFLWWTVSDPFSQWIVHSTNLLFLLIQLGLVGDMCRMMMPMKSSLDNDLVSLLWKAAAMMAALVFIIWLQFGLSLGLYKIEQSYLYFFYFIDGIECTLVCVCLYFFYRWVIPLRNKSPLSDGTGETEITIVDEAEVLPGGRGIVTVDSICVTAESGRWKTSEEESSKDVVYSNLVEPHQLQKTLKLYKRFNVIPNQVTVVDGEQFYDCHIPVESDRVNQKLSPVLPSKDQTLKYNYDKMIEPTQKKNAFYASKYLILDSKKEEIPKYLETRPSVSSKSESPREKEGKRDPFSDFEIVDVVRKWLNENSENMPQNRKTPLMIKQKELIREDSNLKTSKPSTETTEEDLIVEKLDNNQIQFEEQSTPGIVPGSPADTHIGLELNTENDPRGRTTEPPADARNTNNIEGTPTEGVPSQSLNDPVHKLPNKSDLCALAPTKLNKPEEKRNKPTESTDSYLTYSELLELRSKREKSDEPPASNRNSIFSRVINAGSHFLTSFKVFAQADQNSITDEKQPQTKCEQELQTGEKLAEELRHDEPKPHLDLFSSLPEKEKAAELEDAIRRSESIKKRELTLENEMKNDNFDYQGMQNFELQSSTIDKEQLSQKLKEEESSLSSNLGRPSFNWSREQQPQKVMECNREESFEPSSDLNKGQSPQKLTEDEEESLETSSVSEFSIEKGTLRRPTDDEEKSLERFSGSTVVREAYNSNQNLPPQKLTEDKEESLETSSVSECSIEKETLRRPTDDEEKSLERFSGSTVVREAYNSNQNLPPQKLTEDEEESLETSSVSEFSIEKETLRRPTGHKEKPLERFSGSVLVRQALPPQKLKQYEEESPETSSGSEFSIEKIHSYSSGRFTSNQKYRHLRTADTATSQPQVTTASNSEVSAERKPSSSSQESFSLENYYNKVLRARSQLQN